VITIACLTLCAVLLVMMTNGQPQRSASSGLRQKALSPLPSAVTARSTVTLFRKLEPELDFQA
jgi:hypothetical protein